MTGSKNDSKRRTYESKFGKYVSGFGLGDFTRKIRRMGPTIEIPDGGHFEKIDACWIWGD